MDVSKTSSPRADLRYATILCCEDVYGDMEIYVREEEGGCGDEE